MSKTNKSENSKRVISEIEMTSPWSGWLGFIPALAMLVACPWFFIKGSPGLAVLAMVLSFFIFKGVMTLPPNEAVVLVLFGEYRATLRTDGFFWINPFYKRERITNPLRIGTIGGGVRTLTSARPDAGIACK